MNIYSTRIHLASNASVQWRCPEEFHSPRPLWKATLCLLSQHIPHRNTQCRLYSVHLQGPQLAN